MKVESKVGIGFCNILTLIFIVLKLTKVIDWSWWIVLLPTLINISVVFIITLLFAYFYLK